MPSLMKLAALAVIALMTVTSAHPGKVISHEVEARKAFISRSENIQVKCGAHLKTRGIESGAKDRRRALVDGIRKERGLPTGISTC